LLEGKPLIAWSIEHALAVEKIDRVIVSTDCEEIAETARNYGAEVPFIRPSNLAEDDTPEWLAWRHALNYLMETSGSLPDIMISLPATAPLRLPIDIDNCLYEYEKGDVDAVITATDAHRNPYFNMIKLNADGFVSLVNSSKSGIVRRQDVPIVYDMTTVCYVLSPEFVMTHNALFEGKVKMIHVPAERAIDIDTLLDFHIAESILCLRRK
jgi:N-acylneuraminate cytidylyltransferase